MTASHADAPGTLGERVMAHRLALDLSRERLAFRAGVSTSLITRIEREGAVPRADRLAAVAKALGVTITELLDGEAA